MLSRISHIGVLVNDIDAALRIWRDRLGFKKFSQARFEVEGIRSVFPHTSLLLGAGISRPCILSGV
jgi:catechol 2,3-dioxygenase-like lactoylglutathione lyase family enzyme